MGESQLVCERCGDTVAESYQPGRCFNEQCEPAESSTHDVAVIVDGDGPRMKVVYLAHPLGNGDDRERNLENAKAWLAWILETFDVAVVADWLLLAGLWSEDQRERGLRIDRALVERCDEIWLVGGRVSPGMGVELEHAKARGVAVVDLTDFGYEPPTVRPLAGASLGTGRVWGLAPMVAGAVHETAENKGDSQ